MLSEINELVKKHGISIEHVYVEDEENGNDYNLLIEYVDKSIDRARFTRHQIVSMDINESKSVNQRDVDYWPEWWPYYWGSVV